MSVSAQGTEINDAAVFRTALRTFAHESEAKLRALGLTTERYELLLAVSSLIEDGELATVSRLATILGVAQASMTQLVRRSEDARLLRRRVATGDARVRYLQLTAKGQTLLHRGVAELAQERVQLTGILTALQRAHPDEG